MHTRTKLLASLFVAAPAMATDKHTGRLETCLKAALAKQAGTVQTLEAEIEKGQGHLRIRNPWRRR